MWLEIKKNDKTKIFEKHSRKDVRDSKEASEIAKKLELSDDEIKDIIKTNIRLAKEHNQRLLYLIWHKNSPSKTTPEPLYTQQKYFDYLLNAKNGDIINKREFKPKK